VPPINLTESPLWQVTREPLIHQFVGYLSDARRRIDGPPGPHRLEFSRSRIAEVDHAYRRMVRQGEERLHRLGQLMCDSLFESGRDLDSVVVGEVSATGRRFTLTQPLSEADLYGLTDLELGDRVLRRVRVDGRECRLIANRVEYLPHMENSWGVHKLVCRVKAEEELWNKVIDELFDLDSLVRRDKELRHLSRYVKDVFGLKFVVSSEQQVHTLQEHITGLGWSRDELSEHQIPPSDDTVRLHFLETKDYLSRSKASGWAAMKSVVGWWDGLFEIQVQPLVNYYRERERLTRESHQAHKQRRDLLRRQVGERVPLLTFTRLLLRWLFTGAQGEPPSHPGVEVVVGP
jgi:hypothetical protein